MTPLLFFAITMYHQPRLNIKDDCIKQQVFYGEITVKRLATIRQLANLYEAFPQTTIRWLIHKKKTNGFDVCVKRIGRKIVIDLDLFEDWIDKQGNQWSKEVDGDNKT